MYRGRTGGQAWYNYFTAYISVDLAHHKILRAKVGKGGISYNALYQDIRHYMHVLCAINKDHAPPLRCYTKTYVGFL